MNNDYVKPILSLMALFFTISSYAYDFCEANEDGVMIYYKIIRGSDKNCEVTAMEERNS